jgi:hypothetical protein
VPRRRGIFEVAAAGPATPAGHEAIERFVFAVWPNRAKARAQLGLTKEQFRTIERRGELRFRDNPTTGARHFEPASLAAWARDNPGRLFAGATAKPSRQLAGGHGALFDPRRGAITAAVFEGLAQGRPLRDLAREQAIDPETAAALATAWAEMGSDFPLSAQTIAELRDMLDWREGTERSLLDSLSRALRERFEAGRRLGVAQQEESHGQRATEKSDLRSVS